eukprot:TRINITY_DN2210_c0_g2_i6.p1 TRINITY_DN2210_c0_g2~~TRINITY_DN2210_c0_g2_i6.p1  ORF type:complete len:507 (+),score=113.23 TRINITY_DN2210_c0_g2_i6:131-1651(+)
MVINHLPSPSVAQKHRVSHLYEGPLDDECGIAIRECDPEGPLMIYVAKMIPTTDFSRFFAFGRVFSGTVSSGQKVRIMGPNYHPGKREDLFEKSVQRTVLMMGRYLEYIPDVPAGNVVGLVGVDQYLLKQGTISTHPDAHTIRSMKYSVSPVVRVAVEPKVPADLPKLIHGLKLLSKSDPLVQCITEEGGQHIVAGCGELHVEICLNDLSKEYAGCELVVSDPIVQYRETITSESSEACLAKTSNKLNRIYCSASPLGDRLCEMIEKGEIGPNDDSKARTKILVEEFSWDRIDAGRLWTFGPEGSGPNILVNTTKGVQNLETIQDSLMTAFNWTTKEGAICGEQWRGVRLNVVDALIHSDAVHRGGPQIIPAGRRCFYATQMSASPRLQEPMFLAEITAPREAMKGVYQCLGQRRASLQEENQVSGADMMQVKAYLPVAESFGFTAHLRSLTAGQAFPQCVFDHWAILPGDPLHQGSKPNQVAMDVRRRKGMKNAIPPLSELVDRL